MAGLTIDQVRADFLYDLPSPRDAAGPLRAEYAEHEARRAAGDGREMPSCDYRPGTAARRVMGWVLRRPAGSWFWSRAVPGPSAVVAKVLSQLAVRGECLERVAQGLYWRRGPDEASSFARSGSSRLLPIEVGGPGSGFAGRSAVGRVGWSWHPPLVAQVCVVGRAPEVKLPGVVFRSRSNAARSELNWAEVTVLEAVRNADLCDPLSKDPDLAEAAPDQAWRDALASAANGQLLWSLGPQAVLRLETMERVALQEKRPPARFRQRMAELLDALANA